MLSENQLLMRSPIPTSVECFRTVYINGVLFKTAAAERNSAFCTSFCRVDFPDSGPLVAQVKRIVSFHWAGEKQVLLDLNYFRPPVLDRNAHAYRINSNAPYRRDTWLLARLVVDKVVTAKPTHLNDGFLFVSPNAVD
jgi:hypothetical protein